MTVRRLVLAEPIFAHGCDETHFEHRHCNHGRVCALCSPRECWKASTEIEEVKPATVHPSNIGSRWGRHYFTSEKTIFKLRFMLDGKLDNLDDRGLGNKLDEEVHKAVSKGVGKKFPYTTTTGETVEQWAVDVSAAFGVPVIAIVGDNIKVRSDSLDKAIITVVDHMHSVRREQTAKFTLGDAVGAKFAGLLDVPKDRFPDDPKGPMPPPKGVEKEIWVVRHGQAPAYKWSEVLADEVKAFITTLVGKNEKEIETIKVYRPVKMQAKVEVKVDFT